LLLAQGMTRQKEIAIRTAVGASRRAVFMQFVTESLILAAIGGALGVGFGYALLRAIIAVMPFNTLPGEAMLTLSVPVLLVTIAATTFAGLLFGCAPAWYASRVDPAAFLKEGGRAGSSRVRHRLHQLLVIGEFTLALTLLAGAGMAIHSFWNLYHTDTGVRTDHALTFILPMMKVTSSPEQMTTHYQEVLRRIRAVPGVQDASVSTVLPLESPFFTRSISIAGQPLSADPSQRPNAGFSMVSPDYFKTFGIRLVKGRFFTEADNATSLHVAVVNELFVRQNMHGMDPIGKTVYIPQIILGSPKLGPLEPWVIVGVFHDVQGWLLYPSRFGEIEVPFYQDPSPVAAVGVHTARDPEVLQKSISAAVHSIDPNVPLGQVATLDHIRDKQLVGERFNLFLYVGFAVLALALAAVGIYGVIAFSVSQRRHEIGVRMALGADRAGVLRMVLWEGTVLAGVGSLLGLAGAYIVGQAMRTTLYDIGTFDLTAFSAVAALLLTIALMASFFPARRAASVDPMEALRQN
jgi:predicted permease